MTTFLQSVGAGLSSLLIAVSSFFGLATPPEPEIGLMTGAALPSATAVFETSLAAPITSSATSMTLTANSIRGGGSLSGYNCFTVDEGSAQAETICGTVSSTSVTGMTRGISQSTGTSTVSALQFSHRRGANVKITDFPIIQILKAQNNGEDTFPRSLVYDSGVGTTSTSFPSQYSIPNRGYVDAVALNAGAAIGASETANGYVEIATAAEAAASTETGTAGRLVLPASIATSTYNSATAANRVLVTDGTGRLDEDFLPDTISNAHTYGTSTFAGNISLSGTATSTIASSTLYATSTTGTWTKPANLKHLVVTTVGGGGDTGSGAVGGAGGGGSLCKKVIPAAAIGSTVAVTVGAAGSSSAGGTSSFGSFCSSTGGSRGTTDPGSGGTTDGATGGASTGGDLNIAGNSSGTMSRSATAPAPNAPGGAPLLFNYGRGASASGGDSQGLAATAGVVIIESIFY